MSRWGTVDNTRDYQTEQAMGDWDAWLDECTERAMERVKAREEAAGMSMTRQESLDAWAERMSVLAKRRYGKSAECIGTVTGTRSTYTIYTNSYKRELGPYSWAEMDETMEQWDSQRRAALADTQQESDNDGI